MELFMPFFYLCLLLEKENILESWVLCLKQACLYYQKQDDNKAESLKLVGILAVNHILSGARVMAGDEIKLFILDEVLDADRRVEGPAWKNARGPAQVIYDCPGRSSYCWKANMRSCSALFSS